MHKSLLLMLLVVGTAGILLSTPAVALGLGGIEVDSSLNEPFTASVPLTDLGAADPDAVKVTLAGADDFARQGVDRPYYLNALTFSVENDADGASIRIGSKGPMTEPYVNFIVEVLWPEGRLLKRYTVLLNPPGL